MNTLMELWAAVLTERRILFVTDHVSAFSVRGRVAADVECVLSAFQTHPMHGVCVSFADTHVLAAHLHPRCAAFVCCLRDKREVLKLVLCCSPSPGPDRLCVCADALHGGRSPKLPPRRTDPGPVAARCVLCSLMVLNLYELFRLCCLQCAHCGPRRRQHARTRLCNRARVASQSIGKTAWHHQESGAFSTAACVFYASCMLR